MKIYISGKITGRSPEEWQQQFNTAAARLRQEGHIVFNPADELTPRRLKRWAWTDWLAFDTGKLLICDAIYMLPGWQESKGAQIELAIARAAKIKIMGAEQTILEDAQALVYGAREAEYSPPQRDYAKTSAMWSGFLKEKLRPDAVITAEDAVLMMVLLKISREGFKHKRDNLVDAAGYLACAERIVEGK